MMYLYIASILVSFACYIFSNWNDGCDLGIMDLFGMLIVSTIPVLNLIIGVGLVFYSFNVVILKGRK